MLERSLVVGGSVAGLCAAAALSGVSDEVVVFERDRYPSVPAPRRGVPQGGQLHNVLGRAQLCLDELFPGFLERLHAVGCASAVVSLETDVFEFGTRMPHRDLGLSLLCAEQPSVEFVLRQILLERGNVRIHEGSQVAGLVIDDHQSIAGVRTAGEAGGGGIVGAPLVVDASGAGSRVPGWLEELGLGRPREERRHSGHWYVSMIVVRPEHSVGDPRFRLTFPTQSFHRGALLSPLDDRHWYLSVNGRDGDDPPSTVDGVMEHLGTLSDHGIREAVADAPAFGALHRFQRLVTLWRRYDELVDPVPGLLAIGDAVGALDPLFGQGMSLASWEAELLRDLLTSTADWWGGRIPDITRQFHQDVATVVRTAWDLGEEVDRFFAGVTDELSADRMRAFAELLYADPVLHGQYVRMWHLLEPTSRLKDEDLARRMEERMQVVADRTHRELG